MSKKLIREFVREALKTEVKISPSMFSQEPTDSPDKIPSVAYMSQKVSDSFVSAINKSMHKGDLKTSIEQIQDIVERIVMNNLLRRYGKEYYDEESRELDDAAYEEFKDMSHRMSRDAVEDLSKSGIASFAGEALKSYIHKLVASVLKRTMAGSTPKSKKIAA